MSENVRDRIPILNFLFMIEVMLYHCESPSDELAVNAADLWANRFITNGVVYFGSVCMAFFFAVTGMLLFYRLSFRNMGEKLRKRVLTILVPYLLWQGIYLIKSVLQGTSWTLKKMLAQVFLLRIWPPLGAFWYLYAVFLLALLSPLLLPLLRNRKLGAFTVPALIIGLECLQKYAYPRFGYLGNIMMYFPSYLIGSYFGCCYDEMTDQDRLMVLIRVVILGALFSGSFPTMPQRMVQQALPIALLFLFPVRPWMRDRPVYHLSFLLLATHQSSISVSVDRIRALSFRLVPSAAVANVAGRVFGILFCIAVAAVIRAVMKKFCPGVLRVLTGGRA